MPYAIPPVLQAFVNQTVEVTSRVTKVSGYTFTDYSVAPTDKTIPALEKAAKDEGLTSVRVLFPEDGGALNIDPKRLNVSIRPTPKGEFVITGLGIG